MSVLRDFMDKLTPAAPNEPAARPRTALVKLEPHHRYHHNISFRFPTVPSWYRRRGTAGVPPALSTFRFPRRTVTVGKGGRDARGPGSRRFHEIAFARTSRWTAKDGAKFCRALTKSIVH